MMWKLVICLFLCSSLRAFNIHKGIHIRAANNLSNDDLLKIDQYLRKYGYLIDHMPDSQVLASTEDRKYALQFFQNYNKLPVTGTYDEATARLFAKERCGCPDVMPVKNDEEWSKKTNPPKPVEFNLGTKWDNNRLTWRLNSFSRKISQRQVRAETRRAFDLWSKNANLQFTERQSGDVDILIDFATRVHGDGNQNAFDGPGRVLAHAFFPPFGDTHFDDDEAWVVNRTGTDFFTVAAHEFGHALGLGHSEINAALMAPFYSGYQPGRGLHPDDIAGIQALYGAPQTQTAPPPTTPRTTVRPPRTTRAPVNPPTTPGQRPRPYYCTVQFNAIIQDFNGEYLAFVGRSYLIRMNADGLVGIYRQSARLGRLAIRTPDAAFQVSSGSLIMVLRGQRLYRFDRWRRRVGSSWVRGGGATMPEQTRAAIAFSSNDVSVFGYSQVWKMNPNTGQVVSGSHRYISDEFPGVPNGIDAAVIKDSMTIMFFKGQTVYNYSRSAGRVVSTGDKGEAMMPNRCSL